MEECGLFEEHKLFHVVRQLEETVKGRQMEEARKIVPF